MSGWTKLRFKILAVFSLIFFFIVGLLKQILSYLFISVFIILIFSSISLAETWQGVLTAYYNARVQYPSPEKIWIEKNQYGYRLWRRPENLNPFKAKYKYTSKGGSSILPAGTEAQLLNCDGTLAAHVISGCDTCFIERGTEYTIYDSFCDGSESPRGPYGVSGSVIGEVPCWYQTTYRTVNCKSNDVLLQEFFSLESDCLVGNTIQVGSIVLGGSANKGCDCTPEGTEFNSVSSGNCKYTIITGDPAVSPPKIGADAPGFTHITTTTTSPSVTNPDGSTTTTTTNTFPDSSQDVKTSNTVTNLDGTSTTTIITERIVGGASIGTTGTSITTNYADNSSSTVATNSTGTTVTTLTGGGVSQTQTTYGSGLSVTSATGGNSTGNIATSGGGTGTGGGGTGGTGGGGTGGSGTVTVDPETASAVVPIASEKPAYSDSRLTGAEGKTFGDFGSLFTDFSNGVKSTSLFSRFNFNDFSNSISGAASSPIQSINFGRFGAHDVDLSTYDSSFLIIKGIMLILASYLATRIVVLKR